MTLRVRTPLLNDTVVAVEGAGAVVITVAASAIGTVVAAPVIILIGGGQPYERRPVIGRARAAISPLIARARGLHGIAGRGLTAISLVAQSTGMHGVAGQTVRASFGIVASAAGRAEVWSEDDLILVIAEAA